MFQGLAIIDRSSKPEVVWYFSVDNLPEDINERWVAVELGLTNTELWEMYEMEKSVQ